MNLKESFTYPFVNKQNQIHFIILTLLSFIPFGESFFMQPYGTAATSSITVEDNENASLTSDEMLSRFLRALGANFICLFYFFPGFLLLALTGVTALQSDLYTIPGAFFISYCLLVIAVMPLTTIHAVARKNALAALDLPKLLWVGIKMSFKSMLLMIFASLVLFGLKIFISLFSLIGFGLLLCPVKAYSEYVFQYMLAKTYREVFMKLEENNSQKTPSEVTRSGIIIN